MKLTIIFYYNNSRVLLKCLSRLCRSHESPLISTFKARLFVCLKLKKLCEFGRLIICTLIFSNLNILTFFSKRLEFHCSYLGNPPCNLAQNFPSLLLCSDSHYSWKDKVLYSLVHNGESIWIPFSVFLQFLLPIVLQYLCRIRLCTPIFNHIPWIKCENLVFIFPHKKSQSLPLKICM